MLTAVSIVQHAAGVKPVMNGGGVFSFIKYENRGISVALTALLAAGVALAVEGSPYAAAPTNFVGDVPTF